VQVTEVRRTAASGLARELRGCRDNHINAAIAGAIVAERRCGGRGQLIELPIASPFENCEMLMQSPTSTDSSMPPRVGIIYMSR